MVNDGTEYLHVRNKKLAGVWDSIYIYIYNTVQKQKWIVKENQTTQTDYSSIGAMAEGLALVDVEALVVKDMLLSLKHSMSHGTFTVS